MIDKESIINKMFLIRRIEEEIISRYYKQQMRCPVHLSIGQEAVAVGACHHLKKEDSIFSTHRNHAHYLAKGGDLESMILEMHGKIGGCIDGRGGSMHLMDKSVNFMSGPIVASAIPLAVGAALANKIDGNDNIVVCFFGDAATEEGVFHESMNFASLMQLPIIFICENNGYSVDTHIKKRQPERLLTNFGYAHRIATNHIQENDVFKIAMQFETLIELARKGIPRFIVCDTQRSHVHCGVDKEFDVKVDPMDIAIAESKLTSKQLYIIDSGIQHDLRLIFNTAETAFLPTPDMARKYVYAN